MTEIGCDRCGFLAADWTERDLVTSPHWLSAFVAQTIQPVGDELTLAPVAEALAAARDAVDAVAPPDVARRDDVDLDALHESLHRISDLGRALHEVGAGAPTHQGRIDRISTSDGGIPKTAVPSADVGRRGLLGDRQANRKHHGRPFQALCLWSTELIEALQAEGHPIHAGAAGENLTLSGVDWEVLRPGVRLLLGEVLVELSSWAVPCRKNDQWFTGRSDRIDHDQHPGWSRVYAWVREPGSIATGDVVVVEP